MRENSNITYILPRWEHYPPLATETYIVIVVVIVLTLIVGTLGNCTVIFLFAKYKSLRTTPNILLLNLTVASLLMCVFSMPIIIVHCIVDQPNYQDQVQAFVCNGDAFTGAFVGFSGILSVTALAIDRCNVISRQNGGHRSGSKKFSYCSTVLIFIISFTSALAPLLGFGKFVQDGSEIFCTFDFFTRSVNNVMYNVFIQLTFFVVPLIAIVTSYTCIYLTVRKHERTFFKGNKGIENQECSLRRICKERKQVKTEVKIAKVTVICVSVFCISWFPYAMVALIGLFGDCEGIDRMVTALPAIFAKVSTVLNPLIYVILQGQFKKKIVLMLYRRPDGVRLLSTTEQTSTIM
ncbi:OPSD1-like protein [Mya arenaria]|uniref:OPSD1-like protein n=1 Tax=Mya arenaria TaxID=6604 RepID=A0ABY7FQT4_MYAAR|nr:rhodopsin, GQ-coupled-like [Mya arenaria]WAR23957.1 OPSD1-like protein [Mya arenaria]